MDFFKRIGRPVKIDHLSLKIYTAPFSLDRLVIGVDNIRYDVYLSQNFMQNITVMIGQLLGKHAHAERFFGTDEHSGVIRGKDDFRRIVLEILTEALHHAKSKQEIQIDFLAQTATVKLLIEEIKKQYNQLMELHRNRIREYELSKNPDKALDIKKAMLNIQHNRRRIIRNVGKELFQCLSEISFTDLKPLREINFGNEALLPDDLYLNPMFYADDPAEDFFMIEEYDILLGRRTEDPDKYDVLLTLIRELFSANIRIDPENLPENLLDSKCDQVTGYDSSENWSYWESDVPDVIEGWIRHIENADSFFNYYQTRMQIRSLKREKGKKHELAALKDRMESQKKILRAFFNKFERSGLMKRIVASYEMQPILQEYCPPLIPQVILQYLISPRDRKNIENRLRRLKNFYTKSFSTGPLQDVLREICRCDRKVRKSYLLRFLKGFFRYHRDIQNHKRIQKVMDSIQVLTDDDMIKLSRENHTLYEFLLPHERRSEEKPVVHHAIIKADVRGSTDITHQMLEKGLNPASYFSLNFFDPITTILSEYGASKVFVEGDAIILAIYERENTPEGWYSVARSCGLAIHILSIVQRCNQRNQEYELPTIELGIGISYQASSPAFLFDGNNRIVISSAINLADRLSGCSKDIRKKMGENKRLFNLYVFQQHSEEEMAYTRDDLNLRYNLNGIEISRNAFEKLSEEIDLKTIPIRNKEINKDKSIFYTGKFPTASGSFQRLIIREAPIIRVEKKILNLIGLTQRKYYEICTNPKVLQMLDIDTGK